MKIPAVIRRMSFLDSADLDRWLVTDIQSKSGDRSFTLWFRLEDFDTVEIVLGKSAK